MLTMRGETVALEIIIVTCRSDNYAYLLRDGASGEVALVDAPEAGPVEAALAARGWTLDLILITHHHDDHIAGVETLRAKFGAKVVGAAADQKRLPPLDIALREGDSVAVGESVGRVFDVPGHTVGHIAFYFADADALFTADSLMTLGCGRLFEGSAPQMWNSLSKLAALPDATQVYSGHEYTEGNARFALSIDADNGALVERAAEFAGLRAAGKPTVPARMDIERATNPFLRASDPALKARLGMADSPDVEVFAEIRRRKNSF
jgi:hydroxyacylglutathione hydrolase